MAPTTPAPVTPSGVVRDDAPISYLVPKQQSQQDNTQRVFIGICSS